MKKINLKISGFLFISILFLLGNSGCKKLPLQKSYDYGGQALDAHVNMTAWAYMNSRPDVFSTMIAAVNYAGMSAQYEQTDAKYTYLFINNTGMTAFMNKYGFSAITQIDVEKVKKLLQYHIIVGEYHAYDKKLPVEPIYVKTLLPGEDGLLTIKVNKSSANSVGSPITNGNILINLRPSNFLSGSISSVTSNILPTNGAIHVFPGFAFYRRDANYTPVF